MVIDGCPYKENQKERAWETGLSTTVSQISTIGISSTGNILTVNGKSANAVNSVGGSVTDGNLKINVNGVESGDIPLPESDSATELFPFYLTKSYNGTYNSNLYYRPGIQLRTKRIEDTDRIYVPSTIPQYFKIEGNTGTYLATYGTRYSFLIPCVYIENEKKEGLKNVY